MTSFIDETLALTGRWFLHVRRERIALVFSLAQPLVWLLLFGNLFRSVARMDPVVFQGAEYLTFQAPAIVVMTVLGNAFLAGIPLLFDRETGYLERILAAPIQRLSILASRFLFVVGLTVVQLVLLLGLMRLLGIVVERGWLGTLGIIGFAVLVSAGFTVLSLALAFILKGHGAFFAITGSLITPLVFLSSALLPLSLMPGWMQKIALANPLTYAVEGIRPMVIATWNSRLSLLHCAGFLLILDVVLVLVALRIFQRRCQ